MSPRRPGPPHLPGATLGILGGGQLGRMIAFEARRMGYRVAVLDPDGNGPAAQWSDEAVPGSLDDAAAALRLADVSDVLTVETEHIPSALLAQVEARRPLHPSSSVLHTIQDRLRQKEFLAAHGLAQPAFAPVTTRDELAAAVAEVGAPSILKSRTGGYDGKGQARLRTTADAEAAWERLGRTPCVLESFVPFEMELSVLLARTAGGEVRFYPLAENVHRNGILHTTRAPARVPEGIAEEARTMARRIAAGLGHVGVMAVEMFLAPGGRLLVNEVAPRVHNSGHFTLGACATSQFEQHLRAVCGLPLGDTTQLQPAVMLNLLGDLWAAGAPDWSEVLATPQARLHLYGKREARPGRKMAHIVVLDEDADSAMRIAERLHAGLAAKAKAKPTAPARTASA